MGKEAKKYLEDVKLAFPVAYRDEKRFLRDLRDSVYSYEEQNPEYGQEEFYERFGAPREVALGYYHETSMRVYFRMMRRSRYLKRISNAVIVFLIAALMLVTGFCIFSTNAYKDSVLDEKQSEFYELNDYLFDEEAGE